MDLEKICVRKDLSRIVLNYVLMGKITGDQANRITGFIDSVIGGGELGEIASSGAKVYNFPGNWQGAREPVQPEYRPPPKKEKETARIRVLPGDPFPEGYTDYRKILQRDGLILIGWEKWNRITEIDCGQRIEHENLYMVHWVASVPKHFHYQSGLTFEAGLYETMPMNRGEPNFHGLALRWQGKDKNIWR